MELKVVRNYINDDWVQSESPEELDITDPATGEVIGRVPLSTPSEVDSAVQAAKDAFWEWRTTPPMTRARYFFRLKEVLEANFEHLVQVTSIDAGKTLDESRAELRRAIEMVEVVSGIPSLMMGSSLEDVANGIDCVSIRQPLGVFGAITPYNFPTMVPFWFWPFAVACGNTFVIKPSEQDPLTQHEIFQLVADEVGFPPGVVNLVNGGKEAAVLIKLTRKVHNCLRRFSLIPVANPSRPEQVIGNKQATLSEQAGCQRNRLRIILLVDVIENQIERAREPFRDIEGVSHSKIKLALQAGPLEVAKGQPFIAGGHVGHRDVPSAAGGQ